MDICLAGPGQGKSFWLASQPADVHVACTNKPHRTILATIADALGLEYSRRASIDDLIVLLLAAPACKIALDDIDRTSPKINYTLLTLDTHHTILATATDKKRIRPILERQAAVIHHPPAAPLAQIVADRYPTLTPAQIRHIAAQASSPAAALNLARAQAEGHPLPPPPAVNILPILATAIAAVIHHLRFGLAHTDPILWAGLALLASAIRRVSRSSQR